MLIFSIFFGLFSVHFRKKCLLPFLLLLLLNMAGDSRRTTFVDERWNVSTNAGTP